MQELWQRSRFLQFQMFSRQVMKWGRLQNLLPYKLAPAACYVVKVDRNDDLDDDSGFQGKKPGRARAGEGGRRQTRVLQSLDVAATIGIVSFMQSQKLEQFPVTLQSVAIPSTTNKGGKPSSIPIKQVHIFCVVAKSWGSTVCRYVQC